MNDLLAVRLDLEALPSRVTLWKITKWNDIPDGWIVVSRHGDYVGLVEGGSKASAHNGQEHAAIAL